MIDNLPDFGDLTPDRMITAVEDAMGIPFSSLAAPLPSYINRVYEFQAESGERYIAKFYRPGRWSRDAVIDEHRFVLACSDAEIPVIPPLPLNNSDTLTESDGVFFAVFNKRSGRELELNSEENWLRLGAVVARMHNEGAQEEAPHRLILHPEETTYREIKLLLDGGFISKSQKNDFEKVCFEIFDTITPLFEGKEYIRIHGDCHRGNILERPDEGVMIIDFDDMMNGPAVQDIWLLLPGHVTQCQRELDLLAEGYEQFREFDYESTILIEPLRAMRIIYFLAWCARQIDDFKFQANFPDWGSEQFWRTETGDLKTQLQVIKESNAILTRSSTPTYGGRVLTDH